MPLELETINKLTVLFINAFGIFLGSWVLMASWKTQLNRRFAIMTVTGLLWVNFAYLAFFSKDPSWSLFWYKMNAISALLTALSFYSFCILTFLKEEKKHPILDRVILITFFIIIILTGFTNIILKDVKMGEFGMELIYGNFGAILYYIPSLFFLLLIIIWLIKKYFILSPQEKIIAQYFFIGNILWIIFNTIFNIFFPLILHSVKYQHFGDYSVILFLFFTAYAIVKRQLFGIKVVLAQLFVGLIVVLLFVDFLTSASIFEYIWKGAVLVGFTFFGWLLIKSIKWEIKQREEIDRYAKELAQAKERVEAAYVVEKKAKEELEHIDEAKSQFVMATQHHLRTPLTALKGYLSMALEGDFGEISQTLKEKLGFCFESTNRLIKLINEFLDISKLQLGRDILEIKEASIPEILQDVIVEVKPEADKKGVYLTLTLPEGNIPLAMVDSIKLREALYNLTDNAVKYTEKGGVKVELSVFNKDEKDFLLITVTDTGIGMSAEEVKNVFGRQFERGKEAQKVYALGRGIGLYIAASIIRAHKAVIRAESGGHGKGSSFYIELPIKQ